MDLKAKKLWKGRSSTSNKKRTDALQNLMAALTGSNTVKYLNIGA